MIQYRRPSCSSWTESIWSSFGRTIMGWAIWGNPIAARLGKGFQLGMLVRTSSKRVILSCVCGWHKIGWKETKHWSDVEILNKEVDLGEPTSFLDHENLGCTQRQCEISKDVVDNYRTMFELRISGGENRKTTMLGKSEYLFVVLRCGKSCQEMCGTVIVSWQTKTTKQLYKVSTPCIDDHHFKEEEMKSVGELSQVCTQIVPKMFILGTNWKTWYSMVSE